MAAQSGLETAGEDSFAQRQGEMLGEGFSFSGYERDSLYLNLGNKTFKNISGTSGIDSITDGRSALFADFDNDGDLDIFLTTIQGPGHLLFRNNVGQDANWLRVTLVGTQGNREALGAQVRMKTDQGTLTKIKSGGSGYLSQHDSRLLFGLAKGRASSLEVTWPSGAKQTFHDLPVNASIQITQGSDQVQVLSERSFRLPDPLTEEETKGTNLRVKKGDRFPDLFLQDLHGNPVAAETLLQAKQPAIINVWATWCGPCAREMPQLQALSEKYDISIIGISVDTSASRDLVVPHLERKGFTYPNYLSTERTPEALYAGDQITVPLTFLINPNGTIEDIIFGWSEKIPAFAAKHGSH